MNKPLVQKIERIRKRVEALVENNTKLSERGQQLDEEIVQLKENLQKEQQKVEELKKQIKIIKLAQNIGTPGVENGGVTELKRKINEYIKEIDHCITMLND